MEKFGNFLFHHLVTLVGSTFHEANVLVKSNEFESEHRIGTRRLIFHISVFVLEIALTFGKIEKQQKIDRGRPVQKRSLFFISKCKSGAKQLAK